MSKILKSSFLLWKYSEFHGVGQEKKSGVFLKNSKFFIVDTISLTPDVVGLIQWSNVDTSRRERAPFRIHEELPAPSPRYCQKSRPQHDPNWASREDGEHIRNSPVIIT